MQFFLENLAKSYVGVPPTGNLDPPLHIKKVVAKVIFLHLSVILFTGGGLPGRTPLCQGEPPCQGDPPARENPPARETPSPVRETPLPCQGELPCQGDPPARENPPWPGRPPLPGRTPRTRENPPCQGEPPPQEADCSIRSTSGWYASYWNAFLF